MKKIETDETLAEEAVAIVTGHRNSAYGNAEDNFANIARYWNAHLAIRYGVTYEKFLDATDVASMMVGMKLARNDWQPSRDSKVDAIGYILTLDRVERVADASKS